MPGNHNTVTAVILAGGRAQRMGGQDKALQLLAGRPLMAHVISALRPQVDTILINSNRPAGDYRQFGLPVIPDSLPDHPGPLAGLLSALQVCDSELILAVPCDTPLLPSDLVARMRQALEQDHADVCSISADGHLHAAIILTRHNRQAALREYLASGQRKVQDWLRSQRLAIADYSDGAEHFINVNSSEELQQLEQRMPRP